MAHGKKAFYFFSFMLLLFPVLTMAASLSLTPSNEDLSLGYLRSLFGTIENVFVGTGSQIMGAIFRVFNSAVLTIGGFVLMYILIVSTINTAHSGEVLGQKWSSVWVPARAAFGIALLLPKASGYCLIQTLLMWIIVQGIGAADRVWEQALDYINSGGIFIASDENAGSNGNPALEQAEMDVYVRDTAPNYLKIAACMHALEKELRALAADDPDKIVPSFESTVSFNIDNIDESIQFPGEFSGLDAYNVYTGRCGSVTLGSVSNANADTIKVLANEQLYGEMSRLARRYVDNDYAAIDGEESTLATAAFEYYHLLQIGAQYLEEGGSGAASGFIDEAKRKGWILAGTYFFKLTELGVSHANSQANLRNTSPTFDMNLSFSNLPDDDYFVELTSSAKTIAEDNVKSSSSRLSDYIDDHANFDNFQSNVGSADSSMETGQVAGILATIVAMGLGIIAILGLAMGVPLGLIFAAATLTWPLAKIAWGFHDLLMNPADSPLVSLALVGWGMVDFAITAWVIGAITVLASGLVASIAACLNPVPYALQMLLSWFMPMLTVVLASMMTGGAVLMLYVPMIPFLVFMFASLGWFFSVIEAMVAAPLVALGFAHPEGHEVFGKGESALMLVLSVFLRPTMLIIGFLITSMLSYIGLWLLNQAFFQGAVGAVFINPVVSVGMGAVFAWPMLIVMYGVLVIMMMQKIFNYMPKLGDEILIWLGGPSRGFGSDAAAGIEQMKDTVKGAAGSFGKTMDKANKSLKKKADSGGGGAGGGGDLQMGADVGGMGGGMGGGGEGGGEGSGGGMNNAMTQEAAGLAADAVVPGSGEVVKTGMEAKEKMDNAQEEANSDEEN